MPICSDLYYFLHAGGGLAAPPVLLLHGAGGSHLLWPAELRRLSTVRVLTPDLPGHGVSAGLGRHSAREYACELLAFLDAVSIWKTVVVGHGLGAAIALEMALQDPPRIAGLGLISCGLHTPLPAALLENFPNPTAFSQALQSLVAAWFSPAAPPALISQVSRQLSRVRPAVLHGDMVAWDTFAAGSRLAGMKIPTLVICGTEDRLIPWTHARSLSNAIPGAALQVIDSAGHAVMLEQPHRLAALLSVFIKSIPYQPGV